MSERPRLETARLLLRLPVAADAARIRRLAGDWRGAGTAKWGRPEDLDLYALDRPTRDGGPSPL